MNPEFVTFLHEQASVTVTSDLSFGRWGEAFSEDDVVVVEIDRLGCRAEDLPLQGPLPRPRLRVSFSPKTDLRATGRFPTIAFHLSPNREAVRR